MSHAHPATGPSLPSYRQIALTYLDDPNTLKPASDPINDQTHEPSRACSVAIFPLNEPDVSLLRARYASLFSDSTNTITGRKNAALRRKVARVEAFQGLVDGATVEGYRAGVGSGLTLTQEENGWIKRERRWRIRIEKMDRMITRWAGLIIVGGGQKVTIAQCSHVPTTQSSQLNTGSRGATRSAARSASETRRTYPNPSPPASPAPERKRRRTRTSTATRQTASSSPSLSALDREDTSVGGRTSNGVSVKRPRADVGAGISTPSRGLASTGSDDSDGEITEEEEEGGERVVQETEKISKYHDGSSELLDDGEDSDTARGRCNSMRMDANLDVDLDPVPIQSAAVHAALAGVEAGGGMETGSSSMSGGRDTSRARIVRNGTNPASPIFHSKRTTAGSTEREPRAAERTRKDGPTIPTFEILHSITLPAEDIFTVALTYDPLTFRPVIAVGGAGGVIWILDVDDDGRDGGGFRGPILGALGDQQNGAVNWNAVRCRVRRVLKGHGDEILSLKFHPSKPHILASASVDKTVRLWNVSGSGANLLFAKDVVPRGSRGHAVNGADRANGHRPSTNGTSVDVSGPVNGGGSTDPAVRPPRPPAQPLTIKEDDTIASWDYPRGQADEGSQCVAIFAGEGEGGHRASCVDLAFHPTRACMATCGTDYQVRIWPMPAELPSPRLSHRPLTLQEGYKPQVIYRPLFATGSLHGDVVDCIEWIAEDVLVSKTTTVLVVWQWLGFRRYFPPGESRSVRVQPPLTDYRESHSFRMIAKYEYDTTLWFMRFALHRAFPCDGFSGNGNKLALGQGGHEPKVVLIDPGCYSRSAAIPTMPEFGIREDPMATCAMQDAAAESQQSTYTEDGLDDGETIDLTQSVINGDESECESLVDEDYESSYNAVPDLAVEMIPTKGVKSAWKTLRPMSSIGGVETTIWQTAMSPNGAEWMVAVGDRGLIVVYIRESSPREEAELNHDI